MTLNDKGFVQYLVILVLLIGIGSAVYLVQFTQIFRPKASENTDSANKPNLIFVFTGESNAGGLALNSRATEQELAPTTAVKILNNQTLTFEDLDIGTNNLIDHSDLTPTYSQVAHGFELQLANMVKAGTFPDNPHVYVVKTGQGGTFLSDWNEGGVFWNKFLQRTNLAKSQVPQPYQWVVWYSLGVNDYLKPTSVATFKSQTTDHLNKIKAQLPGAVIVVTGFQAMGGNYNQYNQALTEISNSIPNVYVTDTTGVTTSADGIHFDYQGFKTLVPRMIDNTKNALGIVNPPNFTPQTAAYCNENISRIHLEWSQVLGIIVYKVFRSTSQPGSGVKLIEQGHYAYNDETVTPGIEYNYYIEAVVGGTSVSGQAKSIMAVSCLPSPNPSPIVSPSPIVASPSPIPSPIPSPVISPSPIVSPSPLPSPFVSPSPAKKIGDIDNNGKVDIFDFNTFVGDYPLKNLRSDVNKDGEVNIFDFNLLLSNFGK